MQSLSPSRTFITIRPWCFFYLKAIARKFDDHSGAAKSWANLGSAFKAKKDYPAAVRCFEQQLLLGTSELADSDTHRKVIKSFLCTEALQALRACVHACMRACVCACNTHVGSLITVASVYSLRPSSPQCSRPMPHVHVHVHVHVHAHAHATFACRAQALANMGHAYFAAGMDQLQAGEDETACEALCRARDAFRLQLQLAEEAGDDEGVGQACGCVRACRDGPCLAPIAQKEGTLMRRASLARCYSHSDLSARDMPIRIKFTVPSLTLRDFDARGLVALQLVRLAVLWPDRCC
jgi:hypothetical protein